MRSLVIALLLFSSICANAQATFNQEYDIGGYYSHFYDLAYSNDTITLYGFFYGQEEEQWGIVVMQIDTSGNFLHQHEYFDEDGRDYGFPRSYPIIKLSDGSGYLATGMEFESKNAFIIKLDREGKKQFIQEFEDPNSNRNHFRQLLEVEDGILVTGSKQQGSGNRDCAILMKLDFSLNLLWSQNYCPEYIDRSYVGLNLSKTQGASLIGSTASSPVLGSVSEWEIDAQSEIWGLNSLGLPQWKWKSSIGLDEIGIGKVVKLADGNWGYMTKEGWYNAQYNEISVQPKYVVRNESFELVREDTFGVADSRLRGLGSLLKLSDGGFLTVGYTLWFFDTPPSFSGSPYNAISGWMARLDEYGRKMWQRVDTAYWSQEFGSQSYLRNVIELPSGSLVACGYSDHYEPNEHRKAWVIKVDANGCMNPLDCETIVGTQEEPPVVAEPPLRMHVFPNPASEVIQVHFDHPAPALLQLYDVNGRLLRQEQTVFGTMSHRMEVRDLPNGLYWLRAQINGKWVSRKVSVFH
jgi:hypothetical protein